MEDMEKREKRPAEEEIEDVSRDAPKNKKRKGLLEKKISFFFFFF